MKIRFISDIHYWLNLKYSHDEFVNIMKDLKPADVTLIAGDMDTDVNEAAEFLKTYFPNEKVVFIAGNHVVYNSKRKPISDLLDDYEHFNGDWKFLENDYVWLNKDIAVIGTIGWTDFLWGWKSKREYIKEINEEKEFRKNFKPEHVEDYPEEYDWSRPVVWIPDLPEDPGKDYEERLMGNKKSFQGHRMKDALRNMNDYNYGRIRKGVRKVDYMFPRDTLIMHKKAMKHIKRCYNEIIAKNPNATIILMTHHPFVSKCESARFKGDPLNAAFMSNHDNWLKKFKNIKYYHCGHVHNRFFDKIGHIDLICNPMGYLHNYEDKGDIPFDINYIKDIKD